MLHARPRACSAVALTGGTARSWPPVFSRRSLTRPARSFAQTGYVPYYGKNRIRYNNFKWHIYTTDHFEIYYYPEIEQHLERVASYAESAYQQVSSDLKHDLGLQGPARPLQDAERVPAAEHRAGRAARRRAGLRRAVPRPHGAADRRARRRALPPDHARAHAHLRVRHHPAIAAPPRPAAVGGRGPVGLHDRLLEPVRPDDGARRRHRRHRPVDERLPGRRVRRRPPALQPRARRVRVHRVALGQGRAAAVPVRAAQERHRRRRERLRGSVPAQARGVRRAVRQVPEGSLQAVPRQGAAGRLRPRPRAEAREDALRQRSSRSSRRRPAT